MGPEEVGNQEVGKRRPPQQRIGRIAFVPACYAALSYVFICFLIYSLDDPQYYAFRGEPNYMQFRNLQWFTKASLVGACIAFLATYLFAIGFPRERIHTAGMLLLALFHLFVGLFSSLYHNHSHLMYYAWPGALSVAMLWTSSIDLAYAPEKRWKWEAMSFVLLLLGVLSFIPYALGIHNVLFAGDVFLRKSGIVMMEAIGLLLIAVAVLRRSSPEDGSHGFVTLLKLIGNVTRAVIQGAHRGQSAGEVSGVIEETIRNLLSDMAGKVKKTIVCTDIESSTLMIENLGDIDAYRFFQTSWEISCRELKKYGATPPKDLGDGLLTMFDSALNAVKAAIAIQKAHAAFNQDQPPEHRVGLRIGINTGHVFLHQRWDPRGYESHVAQRVTGAAQAGQILISKSTLNEVRSSHPKFVAALLPQVRLKGIRGLVEVFEVTP